MRYERKRILYINSVESIQIAIAISLFREKKVWSGMTTVLQDQLRRLAVAAGVGGGQSGGKTVIRGKPSLLYTFQEASDIGTQDIYNVALQGRKKMFCLLTMPACVCVCVSSPPMFYRERT